MKKPKVDWNELFSKVKSSLDSEVVENCYQEIVKDKKHFTDCEKCQEKAYLLLLEYYDRPYRDR